MPTLATTPTDFADLNYLDTSRSLDYVRGVAATNEGTLCRAAVVGTRAATWRALLAATDLWAANNRFDIVEVRPLDTGITVVIASDNAACMIEDAPYAFTEVLTALGLMSGNVTVLDNSTGESVDY